MKIQVDGKDIFELTDIQKKVIMNDIHADQFEEDMCRRLEWVLMHKYDQCFKRLKQEWDIKFEHREVSVPLKKDKYAEFVFSQPDYVDRKARDAEEQI